MYLVLDVGEYTEYTHTHASNITCSWSIRACTVGHEGRSQGRMTSGGRARAGNDGGDRVWASMVSLRVLGPAIYFIVEHISSAVQYSAE